MTSASAASEQSLEGGETLPLPGHDPPGYRPGREALLVNLGWLATALATTLSNLPFKMLLKEGLELNAEAVAGFMAMANFPIYIKPFAGILSDAVPLLGTRRRSYLILSLLLGAVLWLVLALVPRTFASLLWTYVTLNVCLVMTSTVLGGLMVEVGKRDRITGKLSAQRLGITRVVDVISGPLGGFLASKAFLYTAAICSALHLALVPLFLVCLHEARSKTRAKEALSEIKRQAATLVRSRVLWSAAGLVVLVIAAPGFETPLLFHQRDTLKFSTEFIGSLSIVKALCAMLGAVIYGWLCRRMNLRKILTLSIIFHSTMTLFYLFYRSPVSAMIITGIESMTMVLALLPLYDLAARATPRGSEALGYSLMMSVWNFTFSMSDLLGAWIYAHFHTNFGYLVWVNAGTSALVLLAVPFLPSLLVDRRDGDPEG